jgi:hypothetical protein
VLVRQLLQRLMMHTTNNHMRLLYTINSKGGNEMIEQGTTNHTKSILGQ